MEEMEQQCLEVLQKKEISQEEKIKFIHNKLYNSPYTEIFKIKFKTLCNEQILNIPNTINRLYLIYKSYTCTYANRILKKENNNTDPNFWIYLGIIMYIKVDNRWRDCFLKAAQLNSVNSRYIYAIYCIEKYITNSYDNYYNNTSYNNFKYNYCIKFLILNNTNLKSKELLAQIYFKMKKYEEAKCLWIECIDLSSNNYSSIDEDEYAIYNYSFASRMHHYKPYLDELKNVIHPLRFKTELNSLLESKTIKDFIKKRYIGHKDDCIVCYINTDLIYHDCMHINHALCIDCYSKTDTCPICRFDLIKIKKQLASVSKNIKTEYDNLDSFNLIYSDDDDDASDDDESDETIEETESDNDDDEDENEDNESDNDEDENDDDEDEDDENQYNFSDYCTGDEDSSESEYETIEDDEG